MDNQERLERARIVATARTWLRTPYRHCAKVKHVGADCLTLLIGVYEEAALIPPTPVPRYSPQWHLHHGSEQYLNGLLRYAGEIGEGGQLPGDIVLWRIGRCFSHAAIVIDWPHIIHAQIGRNVTLADAEADASLNFIGENTSEKGKRRPRKFFSYWRK